MTTNNEVNDVKKFTIYSLKQLEELEKNNQIFSIMFISRLNLIKK